MTPAELQSLRALPQFPRTGEDLIRVAGLDGAAALITAWPGQEFPVPVRVGGANPRGAARWRQLVAVVGDEVAREIVAQFGGARMPVPSCKDALWVREQDRIRAEFDRLDADGVSYADAVFDLGIAFGVTGRCIELVLSRPDATADTAAQEAQASLF